MTAAHCKSTLPIPEGFFWSCDRDQDHHGPHIAECDWCDGTGDEGEDGHDGDAQPCITCRGLGHRSTPLHKRSEGIIVWRDGDRLVRNDLSMVLVRSTQTEAP